jgi:hypothetical protein
MMASWRSATGGGAAMLLQGLSDAAATTERRMRLNKILCSQQDVACALSKQWDVSVVHAWL